MAEICYNTDCPYNEWYQCKRTGTCITQLTDGFWYHGNGKLGGEFHPTKPNDEERYGEYVKVKHGRWKKIVHPWYECSECGETAVVNLNGKVVWNYCPNCGARMVDKVELTTSAEIHPEKYLKKLNEVENGLTYSVGEHNED